MSEKMEHKTKNGVWKYKTSKKEKAFEYFVLELIKWWSEQNPDKKWEENHLSTLKVMKLLFFASAVNANPKEGNGLLDIFENWCAQPYGANEVDVMKIIKYKKGVFSFFEIGNRRMKLI